VAKLKAERECQSIPCSAKALSSCSKTTSVTLLTLFNECRFRKFAYYRGTPLPNVNQIYLAHEFVGEVKLKIIIGQLSNKKPEIHGKRRVHCFVESDPANGGTYCSVT
jgi:hypothetical protein